MEPVTSSSNYSTSFDNDLEADDFLDMNDDFDDEFAFDDDDDELI